MEQKRLARLNLGLALGAIVAAFGTVQCGGGVTEIIEEEPAAKTDGGMLTSSGASGSTATSGRVIDTGGGSGGGASYEAGREGSDASRDTAVSDGSSSADAESGVAKDSGESDAPSDSEARHDGEGPSGCACGTGEFCCLTVCCSFQQTCCISSKGTGSCISDLICPL